MKNMTPERIAAACGGTYIGSEETKKREIKGAVIDSRLVEQDFLFIPVKGARVDGHDFIPAVFARGALVVLSEHPLEDPAGAYILVEDTLTAMKRIAEYYRKSLDIRVVGITGSVGKTSTKEMIASVLAEKYNVLKTEGNLNNEIGLPLTIFKIRDYHEVAVLEMGISEFGEMERLSRMAEPDLCVITNIGLCHLENLGTRDGILKAKTECFAHLRPGGIAVLNGDDDKLCTQKTVNGSPAVFYGIGRESGQAAAAAEPASADGIPAPVKKEVYATDIKTVGLTKTSCVIHLGEESFAAEIPIAGTHNVYNALAAACVAKRLGLTAAEIKRGIEAVQTIGGRSNLIHKDGITIIDDCYNANPVSMQASVEVLSNAPGRKIAVLGDMGELGEDERALHAAVGDHFAGKHIDMLLCTGPLSEELARAVREASPYTAVFYFADKGELIDKIKHWKREGDTILVKASHFMGFAEVVRALAE